MLYIVLDITAGF